MTSRTNLFKAIEVFLLILILTDLLFFIQLLKLVKTLFLISCHDVLDKFT
jgi:hypothetical protein